MKKYILSILSLTIISLAHAQTLPSNVIVNPNNTLGSVGAAKTYQYTDNSGNTQNIISPVPGVYISPPQWAKDIADRTKGDRNNKTNVSNNQQNVKNENSEKQVIPTPNQAVKNVLPENTAQVTNTTPVVQKRVGQTLDTTPNSYTNQIGEWNKSTINEFEESGKQKLEQSYTKFLMNN